MSDMTRAKRACDHPICLLAHDLLNQLSVIVGRCDLAGDSVGETAAAARHLKVIRETAVSMAETLKQHQCQLESLARTLAVPKGPHSENNIARATPSEEIAQADNFRQMH